MRSTEHLTPKQIVGELDKYIIGQDRAKRLIALALRSRMRRMQLPDQLKDEVAPKNIIMIGQTGVGKTEIARRIAKLTAAPFVKVEATKFTEVGYVGRDVESMVRDLMSNAILIVRKELRREVYSSAESQAEKRLVDILLPGSRKEPDAPARQSMLKMLREGKLDEKEIEIDVPKKQNPILEIAHGSQIEELAFNIEGVNSLFPNRKTTRRTTVRKARDYLIQEQSDSLIDDEKVHEIAKQRVEQYGIIFIDEIDKIISHGGVEHQNVSREGVQRDILPIVEGSMVQTRYGTIDTTHILFVAAGAFHAVKPNDLIPELQGRFPLRVELHDLTQEQFVAILTQPQNALIRQYQELLKTEKVKIVFDDKAIKRIATYAVRINSHSDNIGARRLHTLLEIILEEISFTADELAGQEIPITSEYIDARLAECVTDTDFSKYIL